MIKETQNIKCNHIETETIKCKKVEIVDDQGVPRILLYVQGESSIIILSKSIQPAIQISAGEHEPAAIHLFNENVPAMTLVAGKPSSGIIIRDAKGRSRVSISVESETSIAKIRCDETGILPN